MTKSRMLFLLIRMPILDSTVVRAGVCVSEEAKHTAGCVEKDTIGSDLSENHDVGPLMVRPPAFPTNEPSYQIQAHDDTDQPSQFYSMASNHKGSGPTLCGCYLNYHPCTWLHHTDRRRLWIVLPFYIRTGVVFFTFQHDELVDQAGGPWFSRP